MATGMGVLLRKIYRAYLKYSSRFLFLIAGRKQGNVKFLERMRHIHDGKRAFIICNGPSLLPEDLDAIHKNGDISFACNKINKIFPKTDWRPTYYAVFDETFQYSLVDTMNSTPASVKFFSKDSYIKTRVVSGCVAYVDTIGDPSLLDSPRFSENLQEVYTIGTTTYSLIQLAVGMGVKEIYIIGCDNSYAKEIKRDGTVVNKGTNSYFDGASKREQATAAATWQMDIAYRYARKYADTHGIKIYNSTRGGYLEEFERVDFDTLFQ